jgi:hypothetical protein
MADETDKVRLARLEERLKVVEATIDAMSKRVWAAIAVAAAWIGNQVLHLISQSGGLQ